MANLDLPNSFDGVEKLKVFEFNFIRGSIDTETFETLLRQSCYGNFDSDEFKKVINWLNEQCEDYVVFDYVERKQKKFVRFLFRNDNDKTKFLMSWG